MSCLYILEVNLLSVVSFALLYIYIMEYYSAIKRNEIVVMWMDLEFFIQSEISQKEKKMYIKVYMCNLEKWYR